MANWFLSSAGWTAVTAWAATTAYNVGDIRRQLAAVTAGNERVWRCTTAGTSGGAEPSWTLTKGSTTNDNTVVWTEITGDATYNTSGSWLAPHARMRVAVTWMAAGDNLYVRTDHAATEAATITITFPGTLSSPNECFIVDTNLALSTGAKETVTGAFSMNINGSVYMESSAADGMIFTQGTGTTSQFIALNGTTANRQYYKNIGFRNAQTGSSSASIACCLNGTANNPGQTSETYFENPRFKFSAAGGTIRPNGKTVMKGGAFSSGSTNLTNIFSLSGGTQSKVFECNGFDFTNMTNATFNLIVGTSIASDGHAKIINCKFPSSWSGSLFSASPTNMPGFRGILHNCDDSNTNYKIWEEDYSGSIRNETTIVRTSPVGASDGTTALTWKMTTPSGGVASYPLNILYSPSIVVRQNLIGSSVTASIDIVHDSVTNLTDADIWIEAEYLSSTGTPISTFINDSVATTLATPADQASSTSTWTTTGLTNPNKQKLSVTFTPQLKGFITARVCLALVNKTVYVNPQIDIS